MARITLSVILLFVALRAAAQYEMLPASLITDRVTDSLRRSENFPEYFVFSRGTELLLNIRDINGDWATLQLFDHNPSAVRSLTIDGQSAHSAVLGHQLDLLYLTWELGLSHSWGNGGFSTTETYLQVIDLEAPSLALGFATLYESSSSEGPLEDEEEGEGHERQCAYAVDYRISNDSIIVLRTEILKNEHHSWSQDQSQMASGSDDSCHPDVEEGIYRFDGQRFSKLD